MAFQTIIYDEGHRANNVRTKTYKALQKISEGSKHRYILTATPIVNSPVELFGILNIISPGCMGREYNFLDRYAVRNKWGGILYPINQEELADKIKVFMIRKTLEEVAPELPLMVIKDIPFDLSSKERKLYDRLVAEVLFEVEKQLIQKIENPTIIQSTLTKMIILAQLTCSMALLGEDNTSTKLDILKDMLEDIFPSDKKVIVFSRFKKMAVLLEKELKKYKPLLITGDVTGEDRNKAVQKFQNDDSRQLLISTDAGGEGLNLDAGSIIFHFSLPWSHGKYVQRNGRIKRLTQKKPTIIYNLIANKTIDAYTAKLLKNKKSVSDKVLGDKPITQETIKEMLNYE